MLALPLLPPRGRSSPAPVWGPSDGRQFSTNFSSTVPSHGLQFFSNCSSVGPFHMSFPWGAVLQEQTAPSWVTYRSTGPGRSLLQCGLPIGSQTPSDASTCSGVWSFMDYRWIFAPPLMSTCCRVTTCFTVVFTIGCRGIFDPVPGAPPPPPSLTLVSVEFFLSHTLTLPTALVHVWGFSPPFLNMLSRKHYHSC